MADNHVQTSFGIPIYSNEVDWWKREKLRTQRLQDADIDQWEMPWEAVDEAGVFFLPEELVVFSPDWDLNEHNDFVWFHGDVDFEAAAAVIQRFLKECRPSGKVGFTWAETCSSPRIDEFSGGGCVISADNVEFMHAHSWVEDKLGESNATVG